jgi:hypothetical protein
LGFCHLTFSYSLKLQSPLAQLDIVHIILPAS